MAFKHKRLKPKDCPICEKDIYEIKPTGGGRMKVVKNREHKELWVEFNDGTNAQFSICRKCFPNLTQEQADLIIQYQIYTWGMEILEHPLVLLQLVAQLKWYVQTAVHLRIVAWSDREDGLPHKRDGHQQPGGSPQAS